MIKFLHTRIRVSNPEESIAFYEKVGFELGEQKTSPQGNQLAFLHLPGNEHFLELTYSPDYEVNVPEDLMHTCVGVPDIIEYCEKLENDGIEIWPSGWKEKFTSGERKMAFIDDPDGYEVEILEVS
ncbi:VOC family protein [Verrucomicrobiaceae bacterium R5-34]|uniref:VOC family protein n=1 Tax=Oceaniferula flava TaxID=2800421 RepID=A0AAE2VEC4_9BACT|nr:VOC family protein [Oceaniferula flavus]MBK1831127.1 VOC family protein [Verrucomicrobiaceae bacterium R5-34]MBK1855644.1 VOC family protein [Oceaniferula flavus]MBM1136950.1 VOC family protein [Oceaniferula flavus]